MDHLEHPLPAHRFDRTPGRPERHDHVLQLSHSLVWRPGGGPHLMVGARALFSTSVIKPYRGVAPAAKAAAGLQGAQSWELTWPRISPAGNFTVCTLT